jgi:hypothetical protein
MSKTRTPTARAWMLPIPLLAAAFLCAAAVQQESPQGLYRSSVVGTDFDFIREGDPDAFDRLEDCGEGFPEMPDKRGGAPLHQKAFLFVAHFQDGTSVHVSIDAEFGTRENARKEALRYTPRLGKLPTALRDGVERLVVHAGGEDTTAFSDVGLIVLYSANATKRIGTHDLEETVFHEAVHAAWDQAHRRSPAWLAAQERDGRFVTDYAAKNPMGEDLAESALFAFALIHHPERIPAGDAARIRAAIPARIELVAGLLPPGKPLHDRVEPKDERMREIVASAQRERACTVDLTKPGMMSDVVSNALMHGLGRPETEVRAFLAGSERRYATGEELLVASAAAFQVEEQVLRDQVLEFHHCNCDHGVLVESERACTVDLTKPGMMSDIVSNALMRGLGRPATEVRAFLAGSERRYATGEELLVASAAAFQIEEQVLRDQVQKFHHCNCDHGVVDGPRDPEGR